MRREVYGDLIYIYYYRLKMSGPSVTPKTRSKNVSIEVAEVHQALDGTPNKANDPNGEVLKELLILQDGTALDLTAHIAAAAEIAVNKVLARLPKSAFVGNGAQAQVPVNEERKKAVKRPHELSDEEESEYDDEDSDNESDNGDVLGAGVNNPNLATAGIGSDELSAQLFSDPEQPEDPPAYPKPQLAVEDQTPKKSVVGAALTIGLDPDLTPLAKESYNFFPDDRVVAWVRSCIDIKLTAEQTKLITDKYNCEPTHTDLFSPIRITPAIWKQMNSQTQKDSDGKYFVRGECEKHLFRAHTFFGLAYAPIIKALSKLLEIPDSPVAKEARVLLGDSIKLVSQGWHEITYARRELLRELVRSDVQPYLFGYEFTHNQIVKN